MTRPQNLSTNYPPMALSHRVQAVPEALSIYINQLVYDETRKGRDIITLSLGEAFFDIPLLDFRRLDFVRGFHYSDSRGIPDLRRKIAAFYRDQYKAEIDPEREIIVTAGSKVGIFLAMQAVVNPGDEVLIQEPAWVSYQEHIRLLDAVPRFIPYDTAVRDYPAHMSERTRLIVLNNPNNPSGRLFHERELQELYALCRPRGIYTLVDEAYSDFLVGETFTTMASVAERKDGVIVVNSLSKNMGMSGWRVGYIIAEASLAFQILKLNQHIITCAPTILQQYLATYFDDITRTTLPQARAVVEKRQRLGALIDELGLRRLGGESTFYFFVNIDPFPGSGLDFAIHLLINHGIAVVPGSAYGRSTTRFVRVSIGAESEERVHDALLIIKDTIRSATFDATALRRQMVERGMRAFEEAVSAKRSAAAENRPGA